MCLIPGGPGSGKVTHCDNLMQEKRGITHINMTDLLQQYAIGNGEILSWPSKYKARPTWVRILLLQ